MSARIRVTEAELHRRWMSNSAVGLIVDHKTQTKVVEMMDGTQYETPLAELGGPL